MTGSKNEVAISLFELTVKVQIGRLKERRAAFEHIISALQNGGANVSKEDIVSLCHSMLSVLSAYQERKSHVYVKNILLVIVKRYADLCLNTLTSSLAEFASIKRKCVLTKSIAKECLVALQCTCILAKYGWDSYEKDRSLVRMLVIAQANLLYCVTSSCNHRKSRKARCALTEVCSKENILKTYCEIINELEPSIDNVILSCYVFENIRKYDALCVSYKNVFLKKLAKTIVSSKSRIERFVILQCDSLLKNVTVEEFQAVLLPAITRAMLRNPEVVLESIANVISQLSFDLSPYALDIGKGFTAGLCWKDDRTRKDAITGCCKLAQQCANVTAVQNWLNYIFDVFHGAEEKLLLLDQKIDVLRGAGVLSSNKVPRGSLEILTNSAITNFFKVLEAEVHERILIQVSDMMKLWFAKLPSDVPISPIIVKSFQKGLNLKAATHTSKAAYLDCLLTYISSRRDKSVIKDLVPFLASCVEKAGAQPTVGPVVLEGAVAACVLVEVLSIEDVLQTLGSAKIYLFDMNKQVFFSDKTISFASTEDLRHILKLSKYVLENRTFVVGSLSAVYFAIVYCGVYSDSSLRSDTLYVLQKLSALKPSVDVFLGILKECLVHLQESSVRMQQKVNNGTEGDENTEQLSKFRRVSKYIPDIILTVCSAACGSLKNADVVDLCLQSLIVTHHPHLGHNGGTKLWLKICEKLKIKPIDLIRNNEKKLTKILIDEYDGSECMQNSLSTVIRLQPESILPALTKRCCSLLDGEQLPHVTDEEYNIFLTPEGKLYNTSILSNVKEESTPAMVVNMKRESKAYSYEEQQEEIQLRKELEEKKKKKAGKQDKGEPELTSKQKEAMKLELEKESEIRRRLRASHEELRRVCSMIEAAINGNPVYLCIRFRTLVPSILKNLQNPLAAPLLVDVFLRLRLCVFTEKSDQLFATFIAHLMLRYQQPKCQLNSAWLKEDLGKASLRAIGHLSAVSLSAPAFAYCLPFLQSVVFSAEADTKILEQTLKIMKKHSEMRGRRSSSRKLNLSCPRYLPRQQMFQIILEMIGDTGGLLQQTASDTILEVMKCCTNDEGCDPATPEEINTLLRYLLHENATVRCSVLRALEMVTPCFPSKTTDFQLHLRITKRVWLCKFDEHEETRRLANVVWDKAELNNKLNGLLESIYEDVIHPVSSIQRAASRALPALLVDQSNSNSPQSVSKKLIHMYTDKLQVIPAVVNELGHTVKEAIDRWEARRGVAFALQELTNVCPSNMTTNLINFYVNTGLHDRNDVVQNAMLSAAIALVRKHGKENFDALLPIFERFLKKTPSSAEYDCVRSSVIILMGCLASHLESNNPKIKPIVNKLIEALSTPSQQVQEAVAKCLPPLISLIMDDGPGLSKKLMHRLLNGATYAERKGAAYGLGAVIKSLGTTSLKELNILGTLMDAVQDKKTYKHREGALFGFEALFVTLEILFEPYVIHTIPHLLTCFGDNSQYVRDAANECARVVMSGLSGRGVKLVLPSLIDGLDDDSWRTKTGSAELLGMMAYCAPKQLSSCLPNIVPKLIGILTDSHPTVQKAGAQSLKVIGSVIRNPEIQVIVPYLMEALQDPSHKISACLTKLIDTKFVHFIDAPSLALLMPVVQRALMDRCTETRKMAAQIIGNMYSLTDEKDLAPYLSSILPGLKTNLLDSAPEVRTVSSFALGAMVRGLGDSCFGILLPWLMQTLTTETSAVDRSGAAQGLSEVIGALGVQKLHSIMPDIISTTSRSDIAPHVKDGYLMMFIYLPGVFTEEFIPYIDQIITPILKALADETEYVRETALKGGRRIVNTYAESAIQLLLPELEKGLFDENWRIRLSSVQLLGDLLFRISGVTGKMSTETSHEDDNFGTEHSQKILVTVLGMERRNRVFAGLYICRSDVSFPVRQAALHVWKVVVTNTPRTLKEILKTLFHFLLNSLASSNYDKCQIAARTVNDLMRKLGERILPEVIPLLEIGLESDDPKRRQGVCIGLTEILNSTSKDMAHVFMNIFIPIIRKTLCDPSSEVRRAAAKSFDALHSSIGVNALDGILPYMLERLKCEDAEISEIALDGLKQIMTLKSRAVFPYLLPHLTATPVNTKILSVVSAAAGDTLTRYLHKVLPTLLKVVASSEELTEMHYCQNVILAVTDDAGLRVIIDTLQEAMKSDDVATNKAAVCLLSSFCQRTKADYGNYLPILIRTFIDLFATEDKEMLQISYDTLTAIFKAYPTDETLFEVHGALKRLTRGRNEVLPGLSQKKGVITLIPLYRDVMRVTSGSREQVVVAFSEMLKLCEAESLKASLTQVAGPLIRVLSERSPYPIKAAVIETLGVVIEKVGVQLKAFAPQLQSTFIKSLTEPDRNMRLKCAYALNKLAYVTFKPDALFSELHATIKTNDELAIREAALHSLRGVIIPAGDKIPDQMRRMIYMMLREMMTSPEDSIRLTSAACLGCLTRWLSPEQLSFFLTDYILVDDASLDVTTRHGRSTVLFVALKENPMYVYTDKYSEKIDRTILGHLTYTDKMVVASNGVRSCCYLFLYTMAIGQPISPRLLSAFTKCMNHPSTEVKQLLPKVCTYLATSDVKSSPEYLKAVIPMLVNGTKEKNTILRANCELALIAILKLREKQTLQQECMNILDPGAKEALNDVIVKVLKKVTAKYSTKEEEIDNTLLV